MNKKLAFQMVHEELKSAMRHNKPFNSPHEGHSVLREEVEELWDEVKRKPKRQSKKRFAAEAKQVAAMAIRFMIDLA